MVTPQVLLIGPGAIGLTVAGALHEAGVAFDIAARTPFDQVHLTPAATAPPATEPAAGDAVFPVSVFTDPAASRVYDTVMLATKANQVHGAADWLRTCVGPQSTLAVFQNGIEHVERVREFVGDSPAVVPVTVALPAHRESPGRVSVEGEARITVPDDPASVALAALFDNTFMQAVTSNDWHTAAWFKLLINASSGIVTVLTRKTLGEVMADEEAAALLAELIDEAAAVAEADGARISPGVGADVASGLTAAAGHHVPSILADRLAGVPTEWRARNDVVLRRAARHGIDVPLHRVGTTLLRLGDPDQP